MESIITLKNIKKDFNNISVLKDVSFEIPNRDNFIEFSTYFFVYGKKKI